MKTPAPRSSPLTNYAASAPPRRIKDTESITANKEDATPKMNSEIDKPVSGQIQAPITSRPPDLNGVHVHSDFADFVAKIRELMQSRNE
jgi:hypothetical protein